MKSVTKWKKYSVKCLEDMGMCTKTTKISKLISMLVFAIMILALFSGGCGWNKVQPPESIEQNHSSEQNKSQGSDQTAENSIDQGIAQNDEQGNDEQGSEPGNVQNNSIQGSEQNADSLESVVTLISESGTTIEERFGVPSGFERVNVQGGSFEEYLRQLPLKPHGTEVKYYDGRIKPRKVHEAVIDMDVGDRDLQQCADAVMRLRAEYLYMNGLYDKIHFNFTNGFKADYSKWVQGYRISIDNNTVRWVKETGYSTDYASFRRYMDMVFAYAGTLSLSREMQPVSIEEMKIGDVFIKGGSPGHCVIVVDMAENRDSGEKLFMLAQSYMPAQDIHILKNPESENLSPWYSSGFSEQLATPEWIFTKDQLMRFAD